MNSDNTLFRDKATLENVAGCAGERNLIPGRPNFSACPNLSPNLRICSCLTTPSRYILQEHSAIHSTRNNDKHNGHEERKEGNLALEFAVYFVSFVWIDHFAVESNAIFRRTPCAP